MQNVAFSSISLSTLFESEKLSMVVVIGDSDRKNDISGAQQVDIA